MRGDISVFVCSQGVCSLWKWAESSRNGTCHHRWQRGTPQHFHLLCSLCLGCSVLQGLGAEIPEIIRFSSSLCNLPSFSCSEPGMKGLYGQEDDDVGVYFPFSFTFLLLKSLILSCSVFSLKVKTSVLNSGFNSCFF